MRKAVIILYDQKAGLLTQDEEGYHFMYDPAYQLPEAEPISSTLSLSEKPYLKAGAKATGNDIP